MRTGGPGGLPISPGVGRGQRPDLHQRRRGSAQCAAVGRRFRTKLWPALRRGRDLLQRGLQSVRVELLRTRVTAVRPQLLDDQLQLLNLRIGRVVFRLKGIALALRALRRFP
jgi:hypothetical protein